jgi:formimidoylglutamate deiminase
VDRWLFNGNRPVVREVHVGGVEVVREGRHRAREQIAARFGDAMRTLLA